MKQKKKKNNKKYLAFGMFALFALAFVSAALIQVFAQKTVNMNVESPVVLTGELSESVNLVAGDGYELYLVEGENKLDKDLDVYAKFSLLDGEGNEVTDTTGFYLAYSEDIQYAYSEEYGAVDNWEDAKVWMFNNLDWFDWYLTSSLENFDSSVITNHGGNSAFEVLAFNTEIPTTLSPGEFKAVVYFDVDAAVTPGEYTLNVELIPTA